MSVLADLEPRVIMDFFDTLTQIPRGSENEKGVSDWVVQFAKDRGLEYHQDDLWCVLVRKPGTPGYEDAPTLILHGHLDMVCAKDDDVEFDFLIGDEAYKFHYGTHNRVIGPLGTPLLREQVFSDARVLAKKVLRRFPRAYEAARAIKRRLTS